MPTRRELLTGGACLALSTLGWRAVAPVWFTPDTAGLDDPDAPLPAWVLALIEGQLRT